MEEIEEIIKRDLEHTGGTLFGNVKKTGGDYMFSVALKDHEALNLTNCSFECFFITEVVDGDRIFALKVDDMYADFLETLEVKADKK